MTNTTSHATTINSNLVNHWLNWEVHPTFLTQIPFFYIECSSCRYNSRFISFFVEKYAKLPDFLNTCLFLPKHILNIFFLQINFILCLKN